MEGGGRRRRPSQAAPRSRASALARHIGKSLVTDEFDMSFFQGRGLDHGCFSPLSVLLDHDENGWSTPIIPLQCGVLQFPVPSAARFYKLGQAIRTAVESYPEDLKVAVVATGGLSHQVHGERCGFNNPPWDEKFMEKLENDPVALTRMTHADHATLGGMESSEIVMWLLARGALSANVKKLHQTYYLPSMTAIATLIFENQDTPMPAKVAEAHRAKMGRTAGGHREAGGHLSLRPRPQRGILPHQQLPARPGHSEHRQAFLADPEALFETFGLTEQERDLIRRRDWQGLIRYGAIFFVLEKLAAVVGVPNPAVYAAFRGMSLDDFLKTRNTQVVYSVGGNEAQGKIEAGEKKEKAPA
ncbi:MAG: gallate dioxygenase [Caulobacteraceae bacterium]